MFNCTSMMGMTIAFPDVCLTPTPVPVPVPYPNMGMEMENVPFEPTIFYACGPSHTQLAKIPLTVGDEAGVNLGVASGLISGPESTTLGSLTVFNNGTPIKKMTALTMNNETNAIGASLVPSQVIAMSLT